MRLQISRQILAAISLPLTLVFSASAAAVQNPPSYRVVNEIKLGGDGGWDLLAIDSSTHRLYVSRGTRTMIVDAVEGKLIAEIPDTPGVHGIALASELGKGFITCGKINSVKVFDLNKNSILATVPVGNGPDAILYEPLTRHVFVFNHKGKTVSVLDAKTQEVIKTIELGGQPELGVADDRGNVFVNLEDTSEVVALDAHDFVVRSRWPLAPGKEPTGLAIDTKNRRLFSGCANRLMVMTDADTGKMLATAPIDSGVDGAAFDPATELIFSSNREGTLTIIKEAASRFDVIQTLPTQKGSRTMVLDSKTHHVYLPAAEFGTPPPPSVENPHPRAAVLPGTFKILDATTTP